MNISNSCWWWYPGFNGNQCQIRFLGRHYLVEILINSHQRSKTREKTYSFACWNQSRASTNNFRIHFVPKLQCIYVYIYIYTINIIICIYKYIYNEIGFHQIGVFHQLTGDNTKIFGNPSPSGRASSWMVGNQRDSPHLSNTSVQVKS